MLIASLAMISCTQPSANPDNANARDLVMVSFTKPEAKAATVTPGTVNTPELGSLWFQYKAVKNAVDTSGVTIGAKTEWTNLDSSAGLAQTIELSRGKWDISLRGFASSANRSSGTNPIFEGNITYDVGADLATKGETVNVELNFTNPSGTGSYEIAVTVPANYANSSAQVKVTVTPSSGSAKTLTKTYSSSVKTQTFSFSGLANGTASVKVEYMDKNGVALGNAVTENMLIMTDMTTRGTSSVTETNTYTISFAGAVNGTAESAPSTQPEYKTIGGAIFYDAGSNGAIYKFYDSGKNLIDDTSLAALQSAKYYTVSGTPSNDRFYVVYPTVLNSGNDLYWGFRANIDIMPVNGGVVSTGTGVGTGKSATAAILSYINTYASGDSASATMPGSSEDISHTSPGGYNLYKNCGTTYKYIWDEIRALNTSAPEGLSDWYIPSKDELSQLATNKAIIISTAAQVYSKINSGYIWSSSAHTSDLNAWYWTSYSSGKISYDNRNNYNSGIACRSF